MFYFYTEISGRSEFDLCVLLVSFCMISFTLLLKYGINIQILLKSSKYIDDNAFCTCVNITVTIAKGKTFIKERSLCRFLFLLEGI